MSRVTKRWACPFCEQTCSRNWNLKIHIKRKHQGLGQPVDLSKIMEDQYRNDLFNQQQLPQHPSLNPGSYSEFFRSKYYQYLNRYYRYKKIGSQKDENTKPYPTSDFAEKFFLQPLRMLREFKQLLADVFPIPYQQGYYFHPVMWTGQNHPYVNWNNSSNNNWSSSIERRIDPSYLVFGYKAMICNYCSEPKIEKVVYKDDSNKAIDDEILHKCNTTTNRLESLTLHNNTLRPEKNNTDALEAQKKQGLALKQVIFNDWLIKGPICLIAAELRNPANGDFAIENRLAPNKIATINCSQVKEIDVSPTYRNQHHYIIRAIKNNPTYLTGDEVDEFLNIVGDSTFAVIKVHNTNNSSVKYYFIALSPFVIRFPRSNYDYDNDNNNNTNNDGINDDTKSNRNVTITNTSDLKNEKIAKDQLLSGIERRMTAMIANVVRNNNKK
jgi:hypothetical protein